MLKKRNAAWKVFDTLILGELTLMIQEANKQVPRCNERLPGSIIESWLASEPNFYERDLQPILAECRGLVLAGFETTAHALAYSFGMMAENKTLSDKLGEVSREAIKNFDNKEALLDNSSFVKNFFMEALRLYPLAPVLGGIATANITAEDGDGNEYGFDSGTRFLFLTASLQRHPDFCGKFAAPDEVNPDRWDVSAVKDQPFLHVFQSGPHGCPGKPLALLEGHIFLLLVASQFEFEFPAGVDKVLYTEELLLRPKDAMPLYVRKRTAQKSAALNSHIAKTNESSTGS